MKVRRAVPADAEAMAHVHHESASAAYAGLAAPDPSALERRRSAWAEVLSSAEFEPYVAVDGDAIVGVLSVGAARDEEGAGELYVIYVQPGHWGTEAGQLLLEQAHATLAERFDEAVLTVLAENPRARRFYERNGWVLERTFSEPHFGGIPTEVARYRRRL